MFARCPYRPAMDVNSIDWGDAPGVIGAVAGLAGLVWAAIAQRAASRSARAAERANELANYEPWTLQWLNTGGPFFLLKNRTSEVAGQVVIAGLAARDDEASEQIAALGFVEGGGQRRIEIPGSDRLNSIYDYVVIVWERPNGEQKIVWLLIPAEVG